ncbi:MAG TPA: electron transfer flavoprotein subunit beta/FixA family protein [Planctomycetota bacterium]|nr:electron transfer flavoprotein subunit beta/FixA family protein [Planctomycetota bacterium]
MRIIVPIKQVPETSSVKMDEETGTMIREGVEAIVNPLDLYAIETALRLREELGGEVIVISMGPPDAERAVREAIAMGCDSGMLLSNRAFAGSDTWATSYALSGLIRKIGSCDLILCGERATDGDTGQVGPGIAGFLDLPVATYVGGIDRADDSKLGVRRLVENGHEILEVDLPAVLTVVKEIGEARLPTLHGKRRARSIEIPVLGPDDLDVEVEHLGLKGSPTRVVKIFRPKVARECVKMPAKDEESIEAAVDALIGFLQDKELLQT